MEWIIRFSIWISSIVLGIALVIYISRKAKEGGNIFSTKPSVEEIARQQLAEEDSENKGS